MKGIERIYFTKEELKDLFIKSLDVGDTIKTKSGNIGEILEIHEMSGGKYFRIQTDNFQYLIREDKLALDI